MASEKDIRVRVLTIKQLLGLLLLSFQLPILLELGDLYNCCLKYSVNSKSWYLHT